MPSVTLNRPKRSEEMWETLKVYIIKQRQKKKQEQEADEEVERQRKERERQQKQDVMTLGETREQILQLEMRLKELKDEKHQLFLQLKKVLNEDDNRRRQLVKENNDMMSLHGYPAVAISGHPQLFLQQSIPLAGRAPIYKVAPQHTLLPPGTLKRSRSPSPPPQSYHQGYGYKPGTIPGYSTQKLDDGRRGHEYVRAVLWNKNTQYSGSQPFYSPQGQSSTAVSYTPTHTQTVYTYAAPGYIQQPGSVQVREGSPKQTPHSVYLGHTGALPAHTQQGEARKEYESSQAPVFQTSCNQIVSQNINCPNSHRTVHPDKTPTQQAPIMVAPKFVQVATPSLKSPSPSLPFPEPSLGP
uniref:G protein pathway suppressor 2 n=1 Tax=Timema cristinae TaxID=61476 RepID=A0A7R9H0C8_TIMCR|nr:unnamed protein product [Timema cristinae]